MSGQGVCIPPSLKIINNNIGPDPLKNHKATKPAFHVGPSWTRQRNAIYCQWWAAYIEVGYLGSLFSPHQLEKCPMWTPFGKTFQICAWILTYKDIGLTLSLLLDDQVVTCMMYGIIVGCTLIGTTVTHAIIFIPKVCITIVFNKDITLTLSLL